MKNTVSPAFLLLGVVASFAFIATGMVMLLEIASPGPARLQVEHGVMAECDGAVGYMVLGGRDWDRNGELTDPENETMTFVCPTSGRLEVPCEQEDLDGAFDSLGEPRHRLHVLLGFENEPVGAGCAFGGLRAEVGVDRNVDGELTPDEITDTRALCHPEEVPGRSAEGPRFAVSL